MPQQHWLDRLPPFVKPYGLLMRLDRPVGIWLLFWPCLWSTAYAQPQFDEKFFWLVFLFLLGSVVMRGAGCVINDIWDRDLDAKVERTRNRPLAAKMISVQQAFVFFCLLLALGFLVLLAFEGLAFWLGVASVLPVIVYALIKRISQWPQIWLGLTFNWGALMGFVAIEGEFSWAAWILYVGCVCWTLGYDTIYAHQDREDDSAIGIGSSALALGDKTPTALIGFYGFFWLALVVTGWLTGLGYGFYAGMILVGGQLIWQIKRLDIDNPQLCLRIFKSNAWLGILISLTILVG